MKKWLTLLALALHLACGEGGGAPRLGTLSLELGQGSGNSIRAVAGSTTYVYITVVGAEGRPVTFQGVNLPDFARLSDEGVLTLEPPVTVVGEFGFTLSAAVGDELVSRDVQLLVERANTPPVIHTRQMLDPRGWELGNPHFPYGDCLMDPVFESMAEDVDRDPIRLELTATPVEPSSGETLTFRTQEQVPGGPTGTRVFFYRYNGLAVKLEGLAPGVTYRFAVRAVDALGGASGWTQLFDTVKCFPFGLALETPGPFGHSNFEVLPGETKTVPLMTRGTPPGPVVLTAENLPSFATLTDTTLTVTNPGVADRSVYHFTLVATSGAMSARKEVTVFLNP